MRRQQGRQSAKVLASGRGAAPGVVAAADVNSKAEAADPALQERRVVEMRRRENLLKALKRP